MQLVHIDPRFLDKVWDEVGPVLAEAVATNKGEESLEQVRLHVRSKHYDLLVVTEDDAIRSVVVTEFIDFPNLRVAHIAYAAKSLPLEGVELFKQWAEGCGASALQAFCGDAQARLFKRFGFAHAYHVMRLPL
jgi:hypothetical protein